MKIVRETDYKVPVKLWLSDIEDGAMRQAANLARLPFAFSHVAIMPDAHQGYGMLIGGVLSTINAIIPNAVGVDIGCGMCAVKTDAREASTESLKKIIALAKGTIPLGFAHHSKRQERSRMPGLKNISVPMPVIDREYDRALFQLGTLGGGNHFIELQKDEQDYIWVMIHSGSRNLGKQVAEYYNKAAINLNARKHFPVPKEWDLAYFPLDTDEGQAYYHEMNFCVEFAFENRRLMMDVLKDIVGMVLNARCGEMINIAHNYAAIEKHFDRELVVHRKGATRARLGETGIIPGSQGSKSYIVEGLGNPESFESCSHGAGRKMGRNQARKNLSLEQERDKMERKGILHSLNSIRDLDEAEGAYKDIDEVMKNQIDLVKIRKTLYPLAVIKG